MNEPDEDWNVAVCVECGRGVNRDEIGQYLDIKGSRECICIYCLHGD